MRRLIAGIALTCCAFVTETAAQDWPDADKAYKACFGETTVDARIAGCNKAIGFGGHYDPKTFNGILNNRGVGFLEKHQFEQAIKDFDLAIRVYIRAMPPYINRASAKTRIGKFSEALQDADYVLKEIPAQPNALALRCLLLAVTDADLERALQACDRSFALRPDNTTTFLGHALALYRQGKFEKALRDCDKGLNKDAKDDQLLFLRGITKKKLGDITGGDADIASAVALEANVRNSFPAFTDQSGP